MYQQGCPSYLKKGPEISEAPYIRASLLILDLFDCPKKSAYN